METGVKNNYSAAETAQLLGISKPAVIKRIQKGTLTAEKVGNSYVVKAADLLIGGNVPHKTKLDIDRFVKKAVHEYGETFRLLALE